MSINLSAITAFLDKTLSVDSIPDASRALNGLQLENEGAVSKIAVAVDGSEKTIHAALDLGADLLILHHGIFWQDMQPVTGISYRKLKAAMDGNLAIYSAHIPLDVHPVYGNNALWQRHAASVPPGRDWTTTAFPWASAGNSPAPAGSWRNGWNPPSAHPFKPSGRNRRKPRPGTSSFAPAARETNSSRPPGLAAAPT